MSSVQLPPFQGVTVTVRAINTGGKLICPSDTLVQPRIEGHEIFNLPNIAFLIEHGPSKTKVLFDGGVRKDFQNFSPAGMRQLLKCVPDMHAPFDVRDVLDRAGYDCDNLTSLIWSHHHWDHIGDATRFPDHCEIVVGPGFKKAFLPGWPVNQDSPLLEQDFANKALREIDFGIDGCAIGGFNAVDFFGDGSFYLLDTPGHSIGHMCGLARTDEQHFVFMGGDICHFPGSFRPTSRFPMPDPLPEDASLDPHFTRPCPASVFTCCHPAGQEGGRLKPYYSVSRYEKTIYDNPGLADSSVERLSNFDASPNVLVAIAHDPAIAAYIPTIDQPGRERSSINNWKAQGLKERCHWDFLNELPQNGKPGRPKLVDGYECAGQKYRFDFDAMTLRADQN
ncbi:beta-lactamase-like protein [Ilyonectria sp. MPI-CAGE-AT-0026]|nr:beta-lactamase-like protein [Ilyonectria sp. MPI-CAGE-AT-0026]